MNRISNNQPELSNENEDNTEILSIPNPVSGRYLPKSDVLSILLKAHGSTTSAFLVDKQETGNGFTHGVYVNFADESLQQNGINNIALILPNHTVAAEKYKAFHEDILNNFHPIGLKHRIGTRTDLPEQIDGDSTLFIAVTDGIEDNFFEHNKIDLVIFDEAHVLDTDSNFRSTALLPVEYALRTAKIKSLYVTATPTRTPDLQIQMPSSQFKDARRLPYLTYTQLKNGNKRNYGKGVPFSCLDYAVSEFHKAQEPTAIMALAKSTSSIASLWRYFRSKGFDRIGLVLGGKTRIKIWSHFTPDESPLVLSEPDLNRCDVIISTKAGVAGYDIHKKGIYIITAPQSRYGEWIDHDIRQFLGRTREGVSLIIYPTHDRQISPAPSAKALTALKALDFVTPAGKWKSFDHGVRLRRFTESVKKVFKAIDDGVIGESLSMHGKHSTLCFMGHKLLVKELFKDVDGKTIFAPNPLFESLARYSTNPISLVESLVEDVVTGIDSVTCLDGEMLPLKDTEPPIDKSCENIYSSLLASTNGGEANLLIDDKGKVLKESLPPDDKVASTFHRILMDECKGGSILVTLLDAFVDEEEWQNDPEKMPGGNEYDPIKGNTWYDYGNPEGKKPRTPCIKSLKGKKMYKKLKAVFSGVDYILQLNGFPEENASHEALTNLERFDELHEKTLENLESSQQLLTYVAGVRKKINDNERKLKRIAPQPHNKWVREKVSQKIKLLNTRLEMLSCPERYVAPLLASMLGLSPKLYGTKTSYRENNLLTLLGSKISGTIFDAMPIEIEAFDLPQFVLNVVLAMSGSSRNVAMDGDLYRTPALRLASAEGIPYETARAIVKENISKTLNSLTDIDSSSNPATFRKAISRGTKNLVDSGILPPDSAKRMSVIFNRIGSRSALFYILSFIEQQAIKQIKRCAVAPLGGYAFARLHDEVFIPKRFMLKESYGVQSNEVHKVPPIEVIIKCTDGVEGAMKGMLPSGVLSDGSVELDLTETTVLSFTIGVDSAVTSTIKREWFTRLEYEEDDISELIEGIEIEFPSNAEKITNVSDFTPNSSEVIEKNLVLGG